MNTYNRYILLYSSLQLLGIGLILKVTEHERLLSAKQVSAKQVSAKQVNDDNKKFFNGVFP